MKGEITMSDERRDLIARIAREITSVGLDDLSELGKVCARLERIADDLQERQPVASRLAQSLAIAVEKIILDECEDVEHPLEVVAQGIAMLQRLQAAFEGSGREVPDDSELFQKIEMLSGAASPASKEEGTKQGADATPETTVKQPQESEEKAEVTSETTVKPPRESEEKTVDATPNPTIQESLQAAQGRVDETPEAMAKDPDPEPHREEDGDREGGREVEGPPDETAVSDNEDGVQNTIEQMALEVMTVGLDDLSGLGTIHTGLESVADKLRETRPVSAELAETLADAVEKVILDEYGGVEDPLDVLARGIALLQRLQADFERDGRETVEDPELALEVAELAGGDRGVDLPAPGTDEGADPDPEAMSEDVPEGDRATTADRIEPEGATPDRATLSEMVSGPISPEPQIDADLFSDFASEAEEHLSTAESTLLSLETDPGDGELLNAVFRSFHTIKGAAGFLNLHDVIGVSHAVEDLLDSVRKGELQFNDVISDVAFEAIDLLKELLEAVQTQLDGGEILPKDVSDFLKNVAAASGRGEPSRRQAGGGTALPIDTPEAGQKDPSTPPAESEARTPAQHVQSTVTPGAPGKTPAVRAASPQGKQGTQQFVRVGTTKLDDLVNLVGELVIAQTQVSQNPEILSSENQKLTKDISQLMKISNEIQKTAMSMRMVPIQGTFERMARMVRDLARKTGKQVTFRTSGEDTELDKNMVEEIVDPLTHMVRNAVDHGVESPEQRKAGGKPEKGTVTLEAYHKGGHIVIELGDDGKGLDREKILKKAVERGLARPDEELTDGAIHDFIFHPGLSTAEQVSEVSGRGVGMDVVRRAIEKLRGKVEVQSRPGKGSTFTIQLPLTLAIIDGMVIGVGGERYILPLTSIVRSLRPRPDQVFTVMGKGEMIKVQEEVLPLLRLHERFDVNPRHEDPSAGLVILVETEAGRSCLLVDELLGMQQVVIKGLNDDLRRDEGLSGCAILGDGRVGLILDANGLVNQAHGKTAQRMAYRSAS